jgi:DNA-binding transcriptional ArsR family regulator
MAKRKDTPAITCLLEKGKLVPVSAYDQELLMKWREGTVLNIEPSEAKPRPTEKRYFAALTELVKVGQTDWSSTDEAHEVIKSRLGLVTPVRKADGSWGSNSRHISSFTDAELEELWEYLVELGYTRYGINLAARPDPDPSPIPAKVEEPKTDDVNGPPSAASSVRGSTYTQWELDWLKQSARMLTSAVGPDDSIMITQMQAVADNLPENIGDKAKEIVQKIYRHLLAVCRGSAKLDKSWIAFVAGCKDSDLMKEAR